MKKLTLALLASTLLTSAAWATEVPVDTANTAATIDGHPLTSVVVTQCNLIVAVYVTMQDGRLVRFDKNSNVASDELIRMAHSAPRSERVEVSCNGTGAEGYQTEHPI